MTQGFFDLARLVASDKSTHKSAFEDLAYAIGRDAYADLNGWHLFLKDMSTMPGGPKMHQLLAEHLGDKVCLPACSTTRKHTSAHAALGSPASGRFQELFRAFID